MGAAGLLGPGQSVPHRRSRAHPPPNPPRARTSVGVEEACVLLYPRLGRRRPQFLTSCSTLIGSAASC